MLAAHAMEINAHVMEPMGEDEEEEEGGEGMEGDRRKGS